MVKWSFTVKNKRVQCDIYGWTVDFDKRLFKKTSTGVYAFQKLLEDLKKIKSIFEPSVVSYLKNFVIKVENNKKSIRTIKYDRHKGKIISINNPSEFNN